MFRFRTNPEFRAPLTADASSTFGYLLAAGVGLVVALFVLMAFSANRGGADTRPDLYSLPTDARYPEGIAADNNSGTFYVSSFSDGSIFRGNVAEEKVKHFLPGMKDGRTQAIGLTLDEEGRLYIAGGFTGKVFIYDTTSRKLVRTFSTQSSGFLNDVTVDPNTGDAYITDSFVPILWRVPAEKVKNSSTPGELEPWLVLDDPPDQIGPIPYTEGEFNLNGIVATPDGRYLLTVQSNTGNLYRIDTQTKQVSLVEGLGDEALLNGDGLVLTDNTLYVIRNQGFNNTNRGSVTKISLDENFESGKVEGDTPVPSPEAQDFPTTGALVGGRLLVVNSQFAEGGPVGGADPEIPFTVSAMPAP